MVFPSRASHQLNYQLNQIRLSGVDIRLEKEFTSTKLTQMINTRIT